MRGLLFWKTYNIVDIHLIFLLVILQQLHQVSQKSPQMFPKHASSDNRFDFICVSLHNCAINILEMTY